MWGCGPMSKPRPGSNTAGPMRSKRTNGPIMRARPDGNARRTLKPSARSRTGGRMTVSMVTSFCRIVMELAPLVHLAGVGAPETGSAKDRLNGLEQRKLVRFTGNAALAGGRHPDRQDRRKIFGHFRPVEEQRSEALLVYLVNHDAAL